MEARARVRDLALEEERLVKSVNDLRTLETEERDRIGSEMKDFHASQGVVRDDLLKEIGTLEQRKAEALKPIDDRLAAVVEREEAADKRDDALTTKERALANDKEEHMQNLEDFADRKDEQNLREKKLGEREVKVAASEESARVSLARAGDAWARNAQQIEAADAVLLERENAVATRERIADIRHEQQEKRTFEQDERDRTLKSQYDQLEKASEQFYKLKNEHHGE